MREPERLSRYFKMFHDDTILEQSIIDKTILDSFRQDNTRQDHARVFTAFQDFSRI